MCLQAFCSSRALEYHRQEYCGDLYEAEVERKPTFVDCSSNIVSDELDVKQEIIPEDQSHSLELVLWHNPINVEKKPSVSRIQKRRVDQGDDNSDFCCYICRRG